jgi:curved DNA-binding protein CbpA
MADYYKVLRVPRDASEGEIKRAYKGLAKRWHPDKNPGKQEEATKKFKKLSESYQVLIDPTKRLLYDSSWIKAGDQEFSRPSAKPEPGPDPLEDSLLMHIVPIVLTATLIGFGLFCLHIASYLVAHAFEASLHFCNNYFSLIICVTVSIFWGILVDLVFGRRAGVGAEGGGERRWRRRRKKAERRRRRGGM